MTFEEARAQFPVLERFAYLNAGTMGPLARATAQAMIERTQLDLEQGRGGKPYFEAMFVLREGVRERLAALLAVPADRIALTSSTSEGCNIVLAGLDLGPDDEVVTTDAEHPGLLGPLHASGARVRVVEVSAHPVAEALDRLAGAVTPQTKLLALSHVLWTTGQVMPVQELREQTGLPILVDGAQSAGAIPVQAPGADFYTVSCQKWLCGPDPLGGLYVADPERLRVALPTYFSVQSIESDGSFVPKEGSARFNSGWLSVPSLAGLVAAFDSAPDWRFERAREAADRCRELLSQRFEVVTEPNQATLVSFRPDGDAAEVAAQAYERGVVIRDLPGTGLLRASCGYWTSDADLERLLEAL
jgi:L-cysteine/cystine lyase